MKIAFSGIDERNSDDDGKTLFEVGAGEEWDRFVARAVARNCAGVECLSGIPGSVGGTPVQNVGAYGQEVAETIDSVLTVRSSRRPDSRTLRRSLRIPVSHQHLQHQRARTVHHPARDLSLTPGGKPRIQYADLKKHFAGFQQTPSLTSTREAVRRIRATKAMLITPGDEDCRSAGSFFKNPVLTADQYDELNKRAAAKGLQIPSYPALDAQRKVSAAWLVEHSGFSKGYRSGQVGISRKHALAIVNRGEATATDILASERPHSAACGRTLGHSARAGTSIRGLLNGCDSNFLRRVSQTHLQILCVLCDLRVLSG